MKYEIGEIFIYRQDLRSYGLGFFDCYGTIKDYSKGTDKAFGEYEFSFFNHKFKGWHRCVVKHQDLIWVL